jgi:hypothetical protein
MTEPWLQGTLTHLPVLQRAVLHSLQMAQEDTAKWCGGLDDHEIHARPFGLPSVAFQLRHIARSLDRFCCYAEGVHHRAQASPYHPRWSAGTRRGTYPAPRRAGHHHHQGSPGAATLAQLGEYAVDNVTHLFLLHLDIPLEAFQGFDLSRDPLDHPNPHRFQRLDLIGIIGDQAHRAHMQ